MKVGDKVMFTTVEASERWGVFNYDKVYEVYRTDASGLPNLLDDNSESWWIDEDTLILVDNLNVTEGWSL